MYLDLAIQWLKLAEAIEERWSHKFIHIRNLYSDHTFL